MVIAFNRSFSLPGSPRLKTRATSAKSYHTRSISLPCRSHPLLSSLHDQIQSVITWQSQPESESAAWICDGLTRLELLHASLNVLLIHHSGLGSESINRMLDDFLVLLDLHDSFKSELVALQEQQYEAQVAVRRNDCMKLESCTKCMKKSEKHVVKFAMSMQEISKIKIKENEMALVIRDVINVTVSASQTVFLEIAALLSATTAGLDELSSVKNSWMSLRPLKNKAGEEFRKNYVVQKLEELEKCACEIEKKSERLFRCLVNVRVSLLNILSNH